MISLPAFAYDCLGFVTGIDRLDYSEPDILVMSAPAGLLYTHLPDRKGVCLAVSMCTPVKVTVNGLRKKTTALVVDALFGYGTSFYFKNNLITLGGGLHGESGLFNIDYDAMYRNSVGWGGIASWTFPRINLSLIAQVYHDFAGMYFGEIGDKSKMMVRKSKVGFSFGLCYKL